MPAPKAISTYYVAAIVELARQKGVSLSRVAKRMGITVDELESLAGARIIIAKGSVVRAEQFLKIEHMQVVEIAYKKRFASKRHL